MRDGEVLKELRLPTAAHRPREEIVADLEAGISELMTDRVAGIGLGVPGLVDIKAGVICNVSNIPAWKDFPVKELLESRFNIPVYIGNDANCFALGEYYFGKGKGYKHLVALALGTGVGAGVIINKQLLIGNGSLAGEFGGIKHLDSSYEEYCSGKFFRNQHHIEAVDLAQQAASGDVSALNIFHEFGIHVGHLIETILYSVGPEAIILGGSLSNAFPYFKSGLKEFLSNFAHQEALAHTLIEVSGNPRIPLLGAGALVLSAEQQEVPAY
ncbi:ROK family protein [Geofilum rubicundum]|uniref:ROK family protein n=1 Tax=Geofilum rubicundum TaxID=472113 RepID=UPI001D0E476B|nr:ROK family protein [Geofilum rubicundum]